MEWAAKIIMGNTLSYTDNIQVPMREEEDFRSGSSSSNNSKREEDELLFRTRNNDREGSEGQEANHHDEKMRKEEKNNDQDNNNSDSDSSTDSNSNNRRPKFREPLPLTNDSDSTILHQSNDKPLSDRRISLHQQRYALTSQKSRFRRPSNESKASDHPDYPDYWMPPQEDRPLKVEFRCECLKVTDVSTVKFTTDIKFVVVFEWNDPRLVGMTMTTNDLPVDLWGPDVILENAQNDCAVLYDSFSLIDARTGRLKRTVIFHGPVYNPMNLKDFPFDKDDLELKFISICNWRTLDESRHGNDPCSQVYTLTPMLKKKHTNVPFFLLGWGGKVNEFKMLGWSVDVINPDCPSKPIVVKFDIHLVRKFEYYMWKVMLPLWLIILTSLAPYGIEVDDFQGRLEVMFTLLLSTVTLLYVVQESIPKVSFLTVVDKVVIATLLALSLSVLFSYLVVRSAHPETLNTMLAIANQAAYWLANIVLLVPPYWRYKRHVAMLEATMQNPNENDRRGRQLNSSRRTYKSENFNRHRSYSFAPKSWALDKDLFSNVPSDDDESL